MGGGERGAREGRARVDGICGPEGPGSGGSEVYGQT